MRSLERSFGLGEVYNQKIASAMYVITLNIEALAATAFSGGDGSPWPVSPVYRQVEPLKEGMANSKDENRLDAKEAIRQQTMKFAQDYHEMTKAANLKIDQKKARLQELRWGSVHTTQSP